MDKRDGYALILNAMVEMAKERGMAHAGDEYALACYQMLESAISEAEVWGIPLAEIGLEGFDTNALLTSKRKAA
jgi:hypothetical protein